MSELHQFALIILLLNIKHHLADFPLQTDKMVKDKGAESHYIIELSKHSFIHAFLTLLVLIPFGSQFLILALFDFISHFSMDRLKASKKLMAKNSDKKMIHFALDQHFHKVSDLAIAYIVITEKFIIPLASVIGLYCIQLLGVLIYNKYSPLRSHCSNNKQESLKKVS